MKSLFIAIVILLMSNLYANPIAAFNGFAKSISPEQKIQKRATQIRENLSDKQSCLPNKKTIENVRKGQISMFSRAYYRFVTHSLNENCECVQTLHLRTWYSTFENKILNPKHSFFTGPSSKIVIYRRPLNEEQCLALASDSIEANAILDAYRTW